MKSSLKKTIQALSIYRRQSLLGRTLVELQTQVVSRLAAGTSPASSALDVGRTPSAKSAGGVSKETPADSPAKVNLRREVRIASAFSIDGLHRSSVYLCAWLLL
jgi:hypothetical protein